MPDIKQWLDSAGKLAKAYAKRSEIVSMLDAEPGTSKALLERLVSVMSREELATFEEEYLHYCTLTLLDLQHRRRAMELYGYFKVLEYQHIGGRR
jgi:hypothetical protein